MLKKVISGGQTGADQAALAMLVSQPTEGRGRIRVRLLGIAEMRDGIAFQAVSATLEDDELGLGGIQVPTSNGFRLRYR